jgi:flagellar assembly protein FliH
MAGRLQLEVFETGATPSGTTLVLEGSELEEARLQSFEQGYKAGWDDAVAAQDEERGALRSEIGRNLQALSFTYHDAQTHLLRAIAPLVCDTVARILPEIARQSLPHHIADEVMALAQSAAGTPVTLVINPAARGLVDTLIDGLPAPPLAIAEEATLGEGQAWLRLGDSETRIDLDAAAATITRLLTDFFTAYGKDMTHG